MKAVIIEDTAVHRDKLILLLAQSESNLQLAGHASSVESAYTLIVDSSPDVIFFDVEIEGGTAFDVLDRLEKVDAQIIFTTAREEYALDAFRWAAIDYLLKPIVKEDFDKAVSRLRKAETEMPDRIGILKDVLKKNKERIALHTQDEIHIVQVSEILRCAADGNYTEIHFEERKKILVTKTLKEYDKMLSDGDFLRVHQSHLVNMGKVKSYVKTDGGFLLMMNGSKIPVSTRRKTLVMDYLGK